MKWMYPSIAWHSARFETTGSMLLFAVVVLWFFSNTLYNFALKAVLQGGESATTGLFVLLVLSGQYTLLSIICSMIRKVETTTGHLSLTGGFEAKDFMLLLLGLIATTAADVGTIGVYLSSSLSLAQAIKSLEPFFLLGWNILLRQKTYCRESIFAVHVVILGILLASYNDPTFSAVGVAFGIAGSLGTTLRATLASWYCDRGGCMYSFIWVTSVVLLSPCLIMVAFVFHPFSSSLAPVVKHAMLVAFLYSLYFTASYTVLARTQAMHHGVLNIGKRAFVVLSAYLFGLETLNEKVVFGLGVSTIGMLMYAETKQNFHERMSVKSLEIVCGEMLSWLSASHVWIVHLLRWTICSIATIICVTAVKYCKDLLILFWQNFAVRQFL